MKNISITLAAFALTTGACAFHVDDGGPLQQGKRRAPVAHVDPGDAQKPAGDPGAPPDQATPAPQLPPWDSSAPFTGLSAGHIRGAVGYADIDAPTDLASVYDDGYYAEITTYAVRSDGVRVMLQLQVANGPNGPFLKPGLAIRMTPDAQLDGAQILGVGCAGPDSGGGVADAFEYTDFDEEPCDTGVGTQQDPNDPSSLDVTLQAVFADDNGDCEPMPGDNGDGTAPLPDPNSGCGGDDGTQPTDPGATDPGATDPTTPPPADPTDPNQPPPSDGTDPPPTSDPSNGGDSAHPFARASFVLTR